MWRRAEWVIEDGTFYPSPTSIFLFLAGPCACRNSTRGSGRCQPSLDVFSRRPAAGISLLACLFAGRQSWLVCSASELHTYVGVWSRDGYLAGWLAGSSPCCCRDGRTEWPDGRDGTWLQGTEGTLFAWRCAAMAGWWLDHAGCEMTTLSVCSCAEQKTDTVYLSIYMVLEIV